MIAHGHRCPPAAAIAAAAARLLLSNQRHASQHDLEQRHSRQHMLARCGIVMHGSSIISGTAKTVLSSC